MRNVNSRTFSAETVRWLDSKPALADSSRVAYKGEIKRLAEHVAHAGVRHVEAVSREAWWEYLDSLEDQRSLVETKRCSGLCHGSIQQARRITRDFFMWALDEKIIDWLPRLPDVESATSVKRAPDTRRHLDFDPMLANILRGGVESDDIVECRAYVTLNLIFWAALKPATLAALKVHNLTSTSVTSVAHAVPQQVELPRHVVHLWKRYSKIRKGVIGGMPQADGPLISHLDREDPVSAWGIWSIFDQWEKSHLPCDGSKITPRSLRSAYLDLLCSGGELTLKWACTHGGVRERRVQAPAGSIPKGMVAEANNQILDYLRMV